MGGFSVKLCEVVTFARERIVFVCARIERFSPDGFPLTRKQAAHTHACETGTALKNEIACGVWRLFQMVVTAIGRH